MSDLLDQFDKTFTLVPAGTYSAVLNDAGLDTTGETPVLEMQWKLLSGDETSKGRNLRMWLRFNDRCGKFLAWQLGVSGARSATGGLSDWKQIAEAAAGFYFENVDNLHVLLKVEISTYNNKERNQCVIEKLIDADAVELDAFEAATSMPDPKGIDTEEQVPF